MSKIVSRDLVPTLTSQGTTALKGTINGHRAFVLGFATVAEFDAAVKQDKVAFSKIIEARDGVNSKGEAFAGSASFLWIKITTEPTAADKLAMQETIVAATKRQATPRVDYVAATYSNTMTMLERANQILAEQELAKQAAALVVPASGAVAPVEPVVA